jgi:hypothetical protein
LYKAYGVSIFIILTGVLQSSHENAHGLLWKHKYIIFILFCYCDYLRETNMLKRNMQYATSSLVLDLSRAENVIIATYQHGPCFLAGSGQIHGYSIPWEKINTKSHRNTRKTFLTFTIYLHIYHIYRHWLMGLLGVAQFHGRQYHLTSTSRCKSLRRMLTMCSLIKEQKLWWIGLH